MIRNIVFDFGGVLVDWNPHYLYDRHFGNQEDADWFLQNICTSAWNSQMDGGKPFAEGCAELSAVFPEWSSEIHLFFDRWIEMMRDEIPGMRELLGELKVAGYGLYGLTNWSAETFCQVRHRYPIFDLLDGMVVSGEEHMVKPDAAIFHCLTERYGLNAEDCLFVDDLQRNVDGALAAGWQGVLFQGTDQLRKDLRHFGICK